MNWGVHITVSSGIFFVCVYRFGCVCVYGTVCVCVCACYTGVLSLYLHTSRLTWECSVRQTELKRSRAHTRTHTCTHMDTRAHQPLIYMDLSEVWGGSDTRFSQIWGSKLTNYVPCEWSKEILLGLRNYLSSMYEKKAKLLSHISTDKMSTWQCTLKCLRENGS